MGLVVRVRDDSAEASRSFGDDQEEIVFGRDPDRCQVVFPGDQTVVGREHVALRRVLGRYRVVLNGDNLVLVDGKPAYDDQELPEQCELRLGPDGPRVVVRRVEREDLSPTIRQGHRAGQATVLHQAVAATGRTRWLLFGVLVVVLGAAAVGLRALLRQSERIDTAEDAVTRRLAEEGHAIADVRSSLGSMHDEITHVQNDLSAVGGDLGNLTETVGSMTQKFHAVEEELAANKDRIEEALRKARPSVYLVLLENAEGFENGLGTAWVVSDGTLATNAHVAEVFGQLAPGVRMLVRSNAETPRTYVVDSVIVHPGYAAFEHVWEGYVPVEGTDAKNANTIRFPGGACDVGLLHLKAPFEGLAPPLPIESDVALCRLDAGDAVGYIGYPMEGVAFGGTPLHQPTAQTQIGSVTAMTDYFGAHGESAEARADNLLIQHSCPAAGGASGSPMIDAQGRVIAVLSAGNVLQIGGGPRISTGVGVNYGQRADLVNELLKDTADAKQAGRETAWESRIQTLYASGHLLQRDLDVEQVLAKAVHEIESGSNMTQTVAWAKQSELEAPVPPGKQAPDAPLVLRLDSPGRYLAIVDADRRREIGMDIQFAPASGNPVPVAPTRLAPWLGVASLETDTAGDLQVKLEVEGGATRIRGQLYRAALSAMTPARIRGRLLDHWLQNIARAKGGSWSAKAVASGSFQLDEKGVARERASLPHDGPYLAVAVAPGFEPIDMKAVNAGDGSVVGEDSSGDHFPAFSFSVESAMDVDLIVVGAKEGTPVEVFVFAAVADA